MMSRILQVAQNLSKPAKSFNLMVAIKLVIHQHDAAKVQIIFETLIALEGIIRIMEESGASSITYQWKNHAKDA